jgi:hypothetical protein
MSLIGNAEEMVLFWRNVFQQNENHLRLSEKAKHASITVHDECPLTGTFRKCKMYSSGNWHIFVEFLMIILATHCQELNKTATFDRKCCTPDCFKETGSVSRIFATFHCFLVFLSARNDKVLTCLPQRLMNHCQLIKCYWSGQQHFFPQS